MKLRIRQTPRRSPDAVLRSKPETLIWGYIAADRVPVLRIRSGQTVRIDTVTHQGLNTSQDPVAFFGAAGIAPAEVLQDAVDVYHKMKRAEGAGPHILTGPVYVEGAQPGDMLEVRILDVEFRVPYGVNSTGPGWGVLPELLAEPAQKIIKLDYSMGMDPDLDRALKNALEETVSFLQQRASLSAAEAYALASLAVDFRVGEAVNNVQMVYGMIPKKLFKQNPGYWAGEG